MFGSNVLLCRAAILLVLEIPSSTYYVRVVNTDDKMVGKFNQGTGPLEGKRMTTLKELPRAATEFFEGLSNPHHSVYFNNNVGDR